MNKKGFTLVELLAVIVIIALISLIAIPNIVGLKDGMKKDQMLDDAKKLISMAKYKVSTDAEIRNFTKTGTTGITCNLTLNTCTLNISVLNINGDIKEDPYSTENPPDNYTNGWVEYKISNNIVKYCVYLEGSKMKVMNNTGGCVDEENLYSRSNVRANQSN